MTTKTAVHECHEFGYSFYGAMEWVAMDILRCEVNVA